jgi:hypothetical protein
VSDAEEAYLAARRKQVAALELVQLLGPLSSKANERYTEAGNEASRIARENGFSEKKCRRLNKEAGL